MNADWVFHVLEYTHEQDQCARANQTLTQFYTRFGYHKKKFLNPPAPLRSNLEQAELNCKITDLQCSATPRAKRAGFLHISKLHASTRAKRARAEKPACCDCTRVAERWEEIVLIWFIGGSLLIFNSELCEKKCFINQILNNEEL